MAPQCMVMGWPAARNCAQQLAEDRGLLQVWCVAGALDQPEAGLRDGPGDPAGAGVTDHVERPGDDEHRAADATKSRLQRGHGSLAGTTQRGGQSTRVVSEALGPQPLTRLDRQAGLAGKERL